MAIVVLADSLSFHGPVRAEPADHPGLWPNLLAAELDLPVELFARQGWTARDAWWALTHDPRLWAQLPTADVLVLAVGLMDMLPTLLPSYLRTGMSYLPTHRSREAARAAYLRLNPLGSRWLHGPLRTLPQRRTDEYLSRIVAAVRPVRPLLPVVTVACPAYDSHYYPGRRNDRAAAAAARAWGAAHDVPVLGWDTALRPYVPTGLNPDGLHWGWEAHAAVARASARELRPLLAAAVPSGTGPSGPVPQ